MSPSDVRLQVFSSAFSADGYAARLSSSSIMPAAASTHLHSFNSHVYQVATAPCTDPIQARFLLLSKASLVFLLSALLSRGFFAWSERVNNAPDDFANFPD